MDAPDPDVCSMPRARVEQRAATSRAIVARVAHSIRDPDLHVIDPMEALCDEQRCRAVIDGELMYRDDSHLSADGARYVWSRIRPHGLRGLAPFEDHSPALARQVSN